MDQRDLSALFVPRRVSDHDLWRVLTDVLGEVDLTLLVVEPGSGPALLAEQLADYRAISVWSAQPLSWDDAAAALSVIVPAPVFATSWVAEPPVACWQTFQNGRAGPAHWEDDRALVKRGFTRLYKINLPLGFDLLSELIDNAVRGLRLQAGRPPVQLGAAMVQSVLSGITELSCSLLGHHLAEIAFDPSDPAFTAPRDVEPGAGADRDDHQLVAELMSLVDSVPHVDLTVSQRVFVTDLARRVLVTDKALTRGQRSRATELLRARSDGSDSGSLSAEG